MKEREKGIALLMVLAIVALLSILLVNFQTNTRIYLLSAVNTRDEVKAYYLARTGVNLSRLFLAVQPAISEGLKMVGLSGLPVWQFADVMVEAFQNPKALDMLKDFTGISLKEAKGLGGLKGRFSVEIVDEDSKINLNMGSKEIGQGGRELLASQLASLFAPSQYDSLFEEQDSQGQYTNREQMISAIIDWADGDTQTFGVKALLEDTFYEMLPQPYKRKNASYDSIEEFRLVRGVDEDIFSIFMNPRDPKARALTVWGTGKININTAPALVLAALICTLAKDKEKSICVHPDPTMLFSLVQYIIEIRDLLGGPFESVQMFCQIVNTAPQRVNIDCAQARGLLTTRSEVFSIYAMAEVGRVIKRIHAVVHTGENHPQPGRLLYWRED